MTGIINKVQSWSESVEINIFYTGGKMRRKSRFSKFYVKYIIKSPVIFYSFLTVGITVFLYFSLTLKLDIVQSIKAEVEQNSLILDDEYVLYSNIIYLYKNKNEEVFKFVIESVNNVAGNSICIINNSNDLSGEINADIVVGDQTLFERIFVKAGRGK